MSQPPISRPPSPNPPNQRDGCVQALLILAGIVMLLPGICVLFVASSNPEAIFRDLPSAVKFSAVSVGGVALIWWAIRRPR
jgi:hypothetical protein